MADSIRTPTLYRLRQTVLANGRVFERGMAGEADAFGELFHPLRTAGYLEPAEIRSAATSGTGTRVTIMR